MRSFTAELSEASFNVLWRALHDREQKLQHVIESHDEESDEAVVANNDIIYLRGVIESLQKRATEAGFRYFRKTGIYPINHTVVIANSVLETQPSVAEELFLVFSAAKRAYLTRLRAGTELTAADHATIEVSRVVGDDPFPFGVPANQKSIQTLVQFAVDQRIIPRPYAPEELFAPSTLKLESLS